MRSIFFFALGVATGILLAPDSGEKTLSKVRSKISEWGDEIEDKLAEQVNGEKEEEED